MGPMARLRIDDVDVLVGSKRDQIFDPEIFLINGIDVTRYEIVAVKSAVHFRAGFEPIAASIISANSPGLSSANVFDFDGRGAGRRRYPLDRETTYRAGSGT
jgi:microcystin degradation protein MlrC